MSPSPVTDRSVRGSFNQRETLKYDFRWPILGLLSSLCRRGGDAHTNYCLCRQVSFIGWIKTVGRHQPLFGTLPRVWSQIGGYSIPKLLYYLELFVSSVTTRLLP